jgi:hypothetical protein
MLSQDTDVCAPATDAPFDRELKQVVAGNARDVSGGLADSATVSGKNKYPRRYLGERSEIDPCIAALHLQHDFFARFAVEHHPYMQPWKT